MQEVRDIHPLPELQLLFPPVANIADQVCEGIADASSLQIHGNEVTGLGVQLQDFAPAATARFQLPDLQHRARTQQILQRLADACGIQPGTVDDFLAGDRRLWVNREQDALKPRNRNSGHPAYYVITSQKRLAAVPLKYFLYAQKFTQIARIEILKKGAVKLSLLGKFIIEKRRRV